MSSAAAATPASYHWRDGALVRAEPAESDAGIEVADSFLVRDGCTLGFDLHLARFRAGMGRGSAAAVPDLDDFWRAVAAAIPREGDWFPRVELRHGEAGAELLLRVRHAPERSVSVVVANHDGADPRTTPLVKGPDLASLGRVRAAARERGAGEAVILSPDGCVVEGAYSGMLWWRGDALCCPSADLERIDSVTARTVVTIAGALGIEVLYEKATPDELDGLEIWAVSALHGIRIVTAWIDGPQPAEMPGRLKLWRDRLGKLSRPLGTVEA